jgi:hypothetical protein
MSYKQIGGIIKDPASGEGIYGATVMLTDANGTRSKAITKTDPEGKYILPYSDSFTHIAASADAQGLPRKLYPLPKEMKAYDPDKADIARYDITLDYAKGVQNVEEVTVQANKNAVECARLGGFYNAEKNTCTLPPKLNQPQKEVPMKALPKPSWWKKNWWWVVGLGVVAVGTTIFIVAKNKKKKK